MTKTPRTGARQSGRTHRTRFLTAKAAHREALAKHSATLSDAELSAEVVSFAMHIEFCETASQEGLEHAVKFIGNGVAAAQIDYDCNPRSTRYVDVRTPYLDYAREALTRRFPTPVVDLVQHLARQREFSLRTFGPGDRAAGVVDHIRKELREIEAAPGDVSEWIDVVILAFDGAMRAGAMPAAVAAALLAKQAKNEARTWPDWRTQPTDKAIEHNRAAERDPAITAGGKP